MTMAALPAIAKKMKDIREYSNLAKIIKNINIL